jgi:hypothetical protein
MGERFGVGDVVDGDDVECLTPKGSKTSRPIRPNPLMAM